MIFSFYFIQGVIIMVLFLFGVSVSFNVIFVIYAYLDHKENNKYNDFFEMKFNRKDYENNE